MRGLVLLPLLLLAACGSDRAEDEAVGRDDPGTSPTAATPIINEGSGNAQAPANAAQATTVQAAPSATPATAARPVGPGQQAYRAIGTEPFWAVTVKGSSAVLERSDKPPRSFAVSPDDDGRTVRYLGEGFAMTIAEGPCSDGMSDAVWSDQVSVAFGEGTLKGCGGDRQDPEDDGGF